MTLQNAILEKHVCDSGRGGVSFFPLCPVVLIYTAAKTFVFGFLIKYVFGV
jgi:hypothetical protein